MISVSRKVRFRIEKQQSICSFGGSFATLRKADHSAAFQFAYLPRQLVAF